MNILELRAALTRTNPLTDKPVEHIYLTIPRKTLPKGEKVQFAGPGSPLGNYMTVKEVEGGGYEVVAVFKTKEITAYLDKHLG